MGKGKSGRKPKITQEKVKPIWKFLQSRKVQGGKADFIKGGK